MQPIPPLCSSLRWGWGWGQSLENNLAPGWAVMTYSLFPAVTSQLHFMACQSKHLSLEMLQGTALVLDMQCKGIFPTSLCCFYLSET